MKEKGRREREKDYRGYRRENVRWKQGELGNEEEESRSKRREGRHEGEKGRGELQEERSRKERRQGKRAYSRTKHRIVAYYKNRTYVCIKSLRINHLKIVCSTSFAEGTDSKTLLAISRLTCHHSAV